MDWKSFEELVKYIYENIGKKTGLTIKGHGKNCIIKGKSGVKHQIDILFSHSDGIHDYLTAIECKYWNRKIGKDIIMKMQAIIVDCNFDKGIIVSKYGFTKSTIKYAKHYNIGLVELRKPNEFDPEFINNRIIFNFKINMNTKMYEVIELELITSSLNHTEKKYLKDFCSNFFMTSILDKIDYLNSIPNLPKKDRKIPTDEFKKIMISMVYLQLFTQECFIRQRDGTENTLHEYIIDAANKKFYNAKPNEIVSYSREFEPNTKFWNKTDLFSTSLKAIKIQGKHIVKKSMTESQYKNYALIIMKVIFENKKFILNEDGSINEMNLDNQKQEKNKKWWKIWKTSY